MLNEEGLVVTVKKTQASGYGGKKTIHVYATSANEKVKEASDVGVEALIQDLTKEDLYLWYLDDGSWHIRRNTMHLYSNELDKEQSNLLIQHIAGIYGIEPALRIDRKQDGSQFYYLYFPRELVRIIRPEIKAYILEHGISTMLYKVGGIDYVETDQKKISNKEVIEMRTLHGSGHASTTEIATVYGYKYDRVNDVIKRKTFKHVI